MAIAIDCFARYGYQGTSIDRIARAAHVTKGAIYYHFRDKEELLFEAVKDRISEFERRITERVTPAVNPKDALQEIAQVCLDCATKDNHRRFILTLMVEALDTNVSLSAQFREVMRRFRHFLRGIVRAGQERGLFRPDVDPSIAAEIYAGGIMGGEIQFYQDPEAVDLAETLSAFVEQFIDWLSDRRTGRERNRKEESHGKLSVDG